MRDPDNIPNWYRLDDRIKTSGQPSAADFGDIHALGVGHVVNLGLHDHPLALADEAGVLAALGMNYVHIPIVFDAPTEADFARFCEVLDALGDTPVHVHCIVNARVSAFLYRYRRERLGCAERHARAALDTIWQPGGVWAAFIGDDGRKDLPHACPVTSN